MTYQGRSCVYKQCEIMLKLQTIYCTYKRSFIVLNTYMHMHLCYMPVCRSPLLVYIAPSPVRSLTLSNDLQPSCRLTWTAPQWMNGDFKHYSIRLYGVVVDHTVSNNALDAYYDCKELEEGTHYEGSIVAVNEHGEGKPSYINFTTSIARECPLLSSVSNSYCMYVRIG